jgi:uncharacterized membrane protein
MVILQFLVAAAAFAVLDTVWLTSTSKYDRRNLGPLLADKPHLGYAVVFSVLDTIGTGLATMAGWLVFR